MEECSADHLGGGGGKRWWEREQEAPKEAPPLDPALVGATSAPPLVHEEWMTTLPTDRVGFNPTEARQFTRNGVQSKGDTRRYGRTRARTRRKASEQWWAVVPAAPAAGGAGGAPMTLADAVALASAERGSRAVAKSACARRGGGADGAEEVWNLWWSWQMSSRRRRARMARRRRIGRGITHGGPGTAKRIWTSGRASRKPRRVFSTTRSWGDAQ